MPTRSLALPLLLALAGCAAPAAPPAPPAAAPRPAAGSRFDPGQAGALTGTVSWRRPPPAVPPFRSIAQPLHEWPSPELLDWPNPNAPLPAASPRAAHGAVVFLRGVVPELGKPWPDGRPRAVADDRELVLEHGPRSGRTGVLRAGDELTVASRSRQFHLVQGRGAAFFSLPLPDASTIARRRLDAPGVVELRSGAGYYWLRAYLFVDHHPYYAHTDEHGRFALEGVPAGEYEVVAWHPDWRVARRERHFEMQRVTQVHYGAAIEARQRLRLGPRQRQAVALELAP